MGNLRDDTVTQGSAFGSQKERESVNRHLETGKKLKTIQVKTSTVLGQGEKCHRRLQIFWVSCFPEITGKILKTET